MKWAEVKSTLCVLSGAVQGGRERDYYSKPLNEFKNSYFSAFAIQSPCLGLMHKMPFAFLVWAEPWAPMHTTIPIAANLGDILQHYRWWSPARRLLNANCLRDKPAVQHMRRVQQSVEQKTTICNHTVQSSGVHGLMLLRSLLLFNTSLWGFSVFSWCNMLGSWHSCRALSAPSKKTRHKP